jgi:serine/threonine protein kinase
MQYNLMETIRDRKFINLSNLYQLNEKIEFLAGLNEKGEVELLRVGQTIAKGTFGKVTNIDNLSTGEAEVIKSGRKTAGTHGAADVENEFSKDEQIFENRKPWGFRQRLKQHATMELKTKRGKQHRAHTTRNKNVSRNIRYDSDYSKDIQQNQNRSFENLLPDFYQMLYTLHYMEQLRMSHGDIKPQNFLVKNVNGIKLVHLADLGDMICFNHLKPNEPIIAATSGTRDHTTEIEQQMFLNYYRHQTPETVQALEVLQGKRDTFAMGATIYKALTGRRPYTLQGNLNAPKDFAYEDIPNVPQAFNDLLRRMLDTNLDTRIGRTEVWNEFNRIIAEYPAIHEKILADIETLGYDQTEL